MTPKGSRKWSKEEVRQKTVEFLRSHASSFSVRQICKQLGFTNFRFYEAFPGGLDEACREAGVEPSEGKALVAKALEARRTRGAIRDEVSSEAEYKREIKKFSSELKEKEFGARLHPSKIGAFAIEMLGIRNQPLLKKVGVLSKGDLQGAFAEAAYMHPTYLDRVKGKILEGGRYKDDTSDFLSYVEGIAESWVASKIHDGSVGRLSPDRADGRCKRCSGALDGFRDGSVRCTSCRTKYTYSCTICGREMKLLENDLLRCMGCGYRMVLNNGAVALYGEEYIRQAISRELRTGAKDHLLQGYELVYTELGPDGRLEKIPIRDLRVNFKDVLI